MLSHEIKNPLSGIKGASQIIQKRVNFKGKNLNLIKLINNETERIKKLLNSLEDFTDDRPIKKKKINLNQVIRNSKESVQAIFNKKNINFIENYDPSLPNINGNEKTHETLRFSCSSFFLSPPKIMFFQKSIAREFWGKNGYRRWKEHQKKGGRCILNRFPRVNFEIFNNFVFSF